MAGIMELRAVSASAGMVCHAGGSSTSSTVSAGLHWPPCARSGLPLLPLAKVGRRDARPCPSLAPPSAQRPHHLQGPRKASLRRDFHACSLGRRADGQSPLSAVQLPTETGEKPRLREGREAAVEISPMDDCSMPPAEQGPQGLWRQWGGTLGSAAAALALAGVVTLVPVHSAWGADSLRTCACLLENCRGELLRCLGDVSCTANIACLQACNGRPDETECQVGCGDLFGNPIVDRFNTCLISEHPCVPQKPEENLYPPPPSSALVPALDLQLLEGPWYISAGLNPLFDTFDCQLHTFHPSGPHTLDADVTWRVRTLTGGFLPRRALQTFVQLDDNPGILLNHGKNILNYKDDWFVLSSKLEGSPDDYFLVYYRGTSDAWDGYGGCVLYTRSKVVPESIVPEVRQATRAAGVDFDRFVRTDNSCKAEEPLLARLEKAVEEEVIEVENKVLEAGKEELKLLAQLGKGLEELQKDKDQFLARLPEEERELLSKMQSLKMGGPDDLEDLFGNAIAVRRGHGSTVVP